jgi:peptide/nickel transport system permease protein
MSRYILRRLVFLLLTIFVTSLIIFIITQFIPGDVCRVILGREAGEAAVVACRDKLGLNRPLPLQYFSWFGNFIFGNWGDSFSTGAPILPLVMLRLRNSGYLAIMTLLISVPIAVGLGVAAGLWENRLIDNLISIVSLSVVGLPEFVTGLVLIQVFSFEFRQMGLPSLPATSSQFPGVNFLETIPMMVLPSLTATLVLLAYIARLTRAGVIEELKQSYVRTADLKGLPQATVIIKHVLRNALMPTITVIAISFGWLISGLVVIENVFNYPGLGRLLVFAIDRRDLPLLQAIAMITVVAFSTANLLADLLYAFLNPRIRLG